LALPRFVWVRLVINKKNVKKGLVDNYHIKDDEPLNMKEQFITELLNIQDWTVENIEINNDGQYIKITLEKGQKCKLKYE